MSNEVAWLLALVWGGAIYLLFHIVASAIRAAGKSIADAIEKQRLNAEVTVLGGSGAARIAEQLAEMRQFMMARDGVEKDPLMEPAPFGGVTSLSASYIRDMQAMNVNPYRKVRADE